MPVYTAPRPETADQLAEVIERHRYEDRLLKERPSFPDCVTCEYHLKQVCQGGCMTYKVYGEEPVRPLLTIGKPAPRRAR